VSCVGAAREADLLAAMREMEGFIDVVPDDLERIYVLAREQARTRDTGKPVRH